MSKTEEEIFRLLMQDLRRPLMKFKLVDLNELRGEFGQGIEVIEEILTGLIVEEKEGLSLLA